MCKIASRAVVQHQHSYSCHGSILAEAPHPDRPQRSSDRSDCTQLATSGGLSLGVLLLVGENIVQVGRVVQSLESTGHLVAHAGHSPGLYGIGPTLADGLDARWCGKVGCHPAQCRGFVMPGGALDVLLGEDGVDACPAGLTTVLVGRHGAEVLDASMTKVVAGGGIQGGAVDGCCFLRGCICVGLETLNGTHVAQFSDVVHGRFSQRLELHVGVAHGTALGVGHFPQSWHELDGHSVVEVEGSFATKGLLIGFGS